MGHIGRALNVAITINAMKISGPINRGINNHDM